jgi:hypothetical protein
MMRKWLAAIVLGFLAGGPAKADVTYEFFDLSAPFLDLEFTVAKQLSPTATRETFLSVGGLYGSDFDGGTVEYLQGPPSYVPILHWSSPSRDSGTFSFTGFPDGNPSNGVPGNGSFPGDGELDFPGLPPSPIAFLGSATISGVPEPATWVLLALGFLGLAAAPSLRSRCRGRSATA